jgi:hypothetical protein
MVTRRATKRRAGGSRADILIRDGEIINLTCKDCFFGVPVEIETGGAYFDGEKRTVQTVSMIECRFDSPQPADPKQNSTEPARRFPLMGVKRDWCGCFRPKNPKCRGQVHCTVEPRKCASDCKNHVDYEPEK